MPKNSNIKNSGFTLIEAMVAIAIASIALLGLAAGQMKSLQYAQNSFQYTVALIQANNTIERIWGDICVLQTTPTTFTQAYMTEAPQDPLLYSLKPVTGYEQTFDGVEAGAFDPSFTVNMSWTDERMTDGLDNAVSLNAFFPTLPDGCRA
jgi:type IV pilus assembly protein PilV